MDAIEAYVQAQFAALKAKSEAKQQGHKADPKEPLKAPSNSVESASERVQSVVSDAIVNGEFDKLINDVTHRLQLPLTDAPAPAEHKAAGAIEVQVGGPPPPTGLPKDADPEFCMGLFKLILSAKGVNKNSLVYRTWQSVINPDSDEGCPPTVKNLTHWRPKLSDATADAKEYDPSKYSSTSSFSLGLCHATFGTFYTCPHGAECPWRHSKLTYPETDWLRDIGANDVLANLKSCQLSGEKIPRVVERTAWDECL
ncbi:uncharacterized protein J4E87_000984 [Alternaria ethzedia]|uniref:uncharacterized protein n=1 Tax=Alternaria ethzedia TaxID=181014 RepID=UPI0020C4E571|nr:uncharacterized protein J4E87_000984 [Alternaria ethzedia]KAI4633818.1 hypothetical protein J4E87_000984 [Alternaria ethzedia]